MPPAESPPPVNASETVVERDMDFVAYLLVNGHRPVENRLAGGGSHVEFSFALPRADRDRLHGAFMSSPERRFFSAYLDVRRLVRAAKGAR